MFVLYVLLLMVTVFGVGLFAELDTERAMEIDTARAEALARDAVAAHLTARTMAEDHAATRVQLGQNIGGTVAIEAYDGGGLSTAERNAIGLVEYSSAGQPQPYFGSWDNAAVVGINDAFLFTWLTPVEQDLIFDEGSPSGPFGSREDTLIRAVVDAGWDRSRIGTFAASCDCLTGNPLVPPTTFTTLPPGLSDGSIVLFSQVTYR